MSAVSGLVNFVTTRINGLINQEMIDYQAYLRELREDLEREELSSLILPEIYEPTEDGLFLKTGLNTYTQCLVAGSLSPLNQKRQSFPSSLSPRLIMEILQIGKERGTCIQITQVVSPLAPDKENDELDQATEQNERAAITQELKKEREGGPKTHSRLYDLVNRSIGKIHEDVYNGDHRLYYYALLLAVKGETTEDVAYVIDRIKGKLDAQRVLHETPVWGMAEIRRAMMPTPDVPRRPKILTVTTGDFVALTSPFKNPNPDLATSGTFMFMNPNTNNPIFMNYDDGSLVNGHKFVLGVSGSGKSTLMLREDVELHQMGYRVIHIVPKNDDDTSHLRVCIEVGGKLIQMGPGGVNFNPLQVFIDPSCMGDDPAAYKKAYRSHLNTVVAFLDVLIGSTTDRMRNLLFSTLSALYKKFELLDNDGTPINIDTKWTDPASWPNLLDLRELWQDWLTLDEHKTSRASLIPLVINTIQLERGNPWDFLVNNEPAEIDNNFIVFDLSALEDSPNVQDAISLLVTGVLNTRFAFAPPNGKRIRTFVTLDEGANLLKNERFRRYIEKLFREARAKRMHITLATQDLAGIDKPILDMLKANTDAVILMANMRSDNVDALKAAFHLTEDDLRVLYQQVKGRGLFIHKSKHVPMYVYLTPAMQATLFGHGVNREKPEVGDGIELDSRVQWIKDQHGIFDVAWAHGLNEMQVPGYSFSMFATPLLNGKRRVYEDDDLPDDAGLYRGQSEDHYKVVCLLAGELCLAGFTNVEIDHNGRNFVADVRARAPDGHWVGFEYAHGNTRTVKELMTQRRKLEKLRKQDGSKVFDEVIFIVRSDRYKEVKAVMGADYVKSTGYRLDNYIKNQKAKVSPSMNTPAPEAEA